MLTGTCNQMYRGRSKIYQGIDIYERNGILEYVGNSCKRRKLFKTEREAAIFVDIVRINNGKEPVNILKKKQNDTRTD